MYPYPSVIRPSRTGIRAPRTESRFYISNGSLSDISEYTELEFNDSTSSRYSYDLYDPSDPELEFGDQYTSTSPSSMPVSPRESISPATGKVLKKRPSLPMIVVGFASSIVRKCRSLRLRRPRSTPVFDIVA